MKSFVVASLAALLACCFAAPHVIKFEIGSEGSRRLGTWRFSNCMSKDQETFVVNNLTMGPDPLSFPGPLNVAFDVDVKSTIDSPLKADVYLGRRIGSTYIKIPCIGNIGSCTYDDLCELLDQIPECPGPFVSAGVPCKCPFKTGHYKLPETSFDVESAIFPAGDYHGQANLTYNGARIGCYDIMATFA